MATVSGMPMPMPIPIPMPALRLEVRREAVDVVDVDVDDGAAAVLGCSVDDDQKLVTLESADVLGIEVGNV